MTQRPLPPVIGATENTLGALLAQTLRTSTIPSPRAWVYLNLAVGGAPASVIEATLQLDTDEIAELEKDLIAQGLLHAPRVLSAQGTAGLDTARALVSDATRSLTDGVSEEHEEIARQVLDTIRTNALKLLAR
ncbi:hypothetical protein [Microbacterium ulmi]|uniref:MarR family transcriptional regulator n=1 Tax=Microbacterium ulmi TaxID=179095 RepID=A0A7Y2M0W4_9MICO|nr:hypothetical protein [Microbacterium ulmi]NII68982.1 hypothetical protein [Microbacterium ulmi]NNH03964.1 hypothetical protein [Microbacterium ulmi]